MSYVGYQYVRDALSIDAPSLKRPARIRPLTRIEYESDHIGIPRATAPESDRPFEHLLFGLRHEGPNLGILIPALRQIPATEVVAELKLHRTGAYARWMGCLWEHANGTELTDLPELGGWTAYLFDQSNYVTRTPTYIPRWRLNFNGLGTLDYCVTVEKTDVVTRGIESRLLERVTSFVDELDEQLRARALTYAYLSETESSFRIEHDMPDETRKQRFVSLLKRAHEQRDLDEDYLCELQRATIKNPLDAAFEYRMEQNHLARAGRFQSEVTYVPPPPELDRELMGELLKLANLRDSRIDPVIHASIISFGFVFLHPFMDGNGRLSRFLFHQMLCRTGAIKDGMILPVSMAIERDGPGYLSALQSFSGSSKEAWRVSIGADETPQFDYLWHDNFAHYRYWDATTCVEFGYAKAEEALQVGLYQETRYLQQFDAIFEPVNAAFDIRQADLVNLVRMVLDNGGRLSHNRHKQYKERVPAGALDFLEQTATAVLFPPPEEDTPPGAAPLP